MPSITSFCLSDDQLIREAAMIAVTLTVAMLLAPCHGGTTNMFDKNQFENLIARVLLEHNLHSPAAVNLLLGTAAQESKFGTYLRQIRGPALGIFQMEKLTFEWLREKYGNRFPVIKNVAYCELEWDLYMSILFARLLYYAMPTALPEAHDVQGLAKYWKAHYNTPLGAGTTEEFVRNFQKYVA
jgi:hypothetical protein